MECGTEATQSSGCFSIGLPAPETEWLASERRLSEVLYSRVVTNPWPPPYNPVAFVTCAVTSSTAARVHQWPSTCRSQTPPMSFQLPSFRNPPNASAFQKELVTSQLNRPMMMAGFWPSVSPPPHVISRSLCRTSICRRNNFYILTDLKKISQMDAVRWRTFVFIQIWSNGSLMERRSMNAQ